MRFEAQVMSSRVPLPRVLGTVLVAIAMLTLVVVAQGTEATTQYLSELSDGAGESNSNDSSADSTDFGRSYESITRLASISRGDRYTNCCADLCQDNCCTCRPW